MSNYIAHAPVIYLSEAFYVIGGQSKGPQLHSTIGRLDTKTLEWTEAGNLVAKRSGHNAIFDGEVLIVVGGAGPLYDDSIMSEVCSVVNGTEMMCESQEPELDGYGYYPELFSVWPAFCKT